jgi:hypothetical protein
MMLLLLLLVPRKILLLLLLLLVLLLVLLLELHRAPTSWVVQQPALRSTLWFPSPTAPDL